MLCLLRSKAYKIFKVLRPVYFTYFVLLLKEYIKYALIFVVTRVIFNTLIFPGFNF
jgi:hypothetical protein